MSDSTEGVRRKLGTAGNLQSVVRTMKALAASSIGQYEQSVRALADYHRSVELGLGACLRGSEPLAAFAPHPGSAADAAIGAVVFGSDQGLVGPFNERIADHAIATLLGLPGKPRVWAVGERVQVRLQDAGMSPIGPLPVPNSVQVIASLVGQVLVETELRHDGEGLHELHLFHNRPLAGAVYESSSQRLLPLDESWRRKHAGLAWPTARMPEMMGGGSATLRALIREYLFVSVFRACAESLASENAARLAAMQRAERNIDELLQRLTASFHRLRQSRIDEELFDLGAGFEALTAEAAASSGSGSIKDYKGTP